jgi:hypothetical protein
MSWIWQRKKTRLPRLSDAEEIQAAYRRELQALCKEVGADEFIGSLPQGIIDGRGFGEALDSLDPETLPTLGFQPEHIRVMKGLTCLLANCARVEASKQNLSIFLHLFHPAKPTTPLVADAFDEVLAAVISNIG